MKPESKLGMLLAMASSFSTIDNHIERKSDNKLVVKQDFGDGETSQRLRQGQKQYSGGTNTVWARSQKIAEKKLNKLKK